MGTAKRETEDQVPAEFVPSQFEHELVFHFYDQSNTDVIRGGATVVYNPKNHYMAAAICSQRDTYSRRRGRMICRNRLASPRLLHQSTLPVPHSFMPVRDYFGDDTIAAIREAATQFAIKCANAVNCRTDLNKIIWKQEQRLRS